MPSGEGLPLRIPLAHVGDPRVGEHDARSLARHLERQPPAGDLDPSVDIGHRSASRSRYTAEPIGRRQCVDAIAW